jgi:hypothetical protein
MSSPIFMARIVSDLSALAKQKAESKSKIDDFPCGIGKLEEWRKPVYPLANRKCAKARLNRYDIVPEIAEDYLLTHAWHKNEVGIGTKP